MPKDKQTLKQRLDKYLTSPDIWNLSINLSDESSYQDFLDNLNNYAGKLCSIITGADEDAFKGNDSLLALHKIFHAPEINPDFPKRAGLAERFRERFQEAIKDYLGECAMLAGYDLSDLDQWDPHTFKDFDYTSPDAIAAESEDKTAHTDAWSRPPTPVAFTVKEPVPVIKKTCFGLPKNPDEDTLCKHIEAQPPGHFRGSTGIIVAIYAAREGYAEAFFDIVNRPDVNPYNLYQGKFIKQYIEGGTFGVVNPNSPSKSAMDLIYYGLFNPGEAVYIERAYNSTTLLTTLTNAQIRATKERLDTCTGVLIPDFPWEDSAAIDDRLKLYQEHLPVPELCRTDLRFEQVMQQRQERSAVGPATASIRFGEVDISR
jgi:hypothetical protein